jgi:hypothetical protein
MRTDRYAQCDETCTVDCGACKGAGPPSPGVVRSYVARPLVAIENEQREAEYRAARQVVAEDLRRARHESFWRGVLAGVAVGVPATAGAAYLLTGLKLLAWWL